MTTEVTGVVAANIAATNAFDPEAAMATFAEDSHVNDNLREFDTIVRGGYDGTYDKTNLPEEIVPSNYYSVRDGKIVSSW